MSPKRNAQPLSEDDPELAALREELQQARLDYADKVIEITAKIHRLEALRNSDHTGSIGSVKSSPRQKRSGRPPTSTFAKAVGNIREWADKHGYPYSTVKKWSVKGKDGAAIPHDVAQKLLREYKIPISSWPHGTYD